MLNTVFKGDVQYMTKFYLIIVQIDAPYRLLYVMIVSERKIYYLSRKGRRLDNLYVLNEIMIRDK